MKTTTYTREQMAARIFRYGERRVHVNHSGDTTIPQAVFDALNPPLYMLMAHASAAVPEHSRPAIVGAKGLSVAILEIPPGQKVPLHVHMRSREAYVCLRGRVKFRWNDHGEDEAILAPYDMIDVPVGVYRDFQCVGDEPVLLLGIITDDREDEPDDIFIAAEERTRLAERFGPEILAQLDATTGLHFSDPADDLDR